MKRLILILVSIISSSQAFSQTFHPNPLSTVTYVFNSDEDSTITSREVTGFDENGGMISDVTYTWSASLGRWIGNHRYERKTNEGTGETTEIHYYWDSDSLKWYPSEKTIIKTDASGNTTSTTGWSWDRINHTWYGTYRRDYTWNTGRRPDTETFSSWSWESKGFVPYYRDQYLYDNDWNEILIMTYNYTKSRGWYISAKSVSSYSNGKILYRTSYSYQSHSDSFEVYSTHIYNYNLNGLLVNSQFLEGLGYYGPGIYTYKTDYLYNNKGVITEEAHYYYNPDSLKYLQYFKNSYVFNEKGEQTYYAYYYSVSGSSDWWLAYEYETYFNADGRAYQSLSRSYQYGTSILLNSSMEIISYDENGNKSSSLYSSRSGPDAMWLKNFRLCYAYAYKTTDLYSPQITVFPNPFTDILYIGLPYEIVGSSKDIYDINGKKVYSSVDEYASLSKLPKGVYWLIVRDANGKTLKTTKIVKL